MAEWIKFDDSKEHRLKLERRNNGNVLVKFKNGDTQMGGAFSYDHVDSFLICEPHPHRDMIIEWANTGRPVWVRYPKETEWELVDPSWSVECEYSFDPPKPKIKYRVALMEEGTMTADSEKDEIDLKKSNNFVKWLTDWIEVEA
jgi:hypothetical protein